MDHDFFLENVGYSNLADVSDRYLSEYSSHAKDESNHTSIYIYLHQFITVTIAIFEKLS
jgi:hypothetical protein